MNISQTADAKLPVNERQTISGIGLRVRRPLFTRPAEAYRSDAIIGHVQILAEQRNHVQTSLAVVAQELKQIFAFHQNELCVIEQLSGDFVIASGQSSAHSQNFSRDGDPQNQALAGF